MQKAMVAASLAALVSCSLPPPSPSQLFAGPMGQPQLQRSTLPIPVAGRPVHYVGRSDGGRLSADLTPLADGRVRAEGSVMGTGSACSGTFSGTGTFQGRTLQVQDGTAPGCVVTLVRNGRSLNVDAEGRACSALHGAACSLSGTLVQR